MNRGCSLYQVKVPGSIMLFGEHAVLYGEAAIVAAVNRYLIISLNPRSDQMVRVVSSGFADWQGDLSEIDKMSEKLNYLREALRSYRDVLSSGLDLIIDAVGFSSRVGLGSSAAVTVGVVALLERLSSGSVPDSYQVYQKALAIVHRISPMASGADVAASVYGGVNLYSLGHISKQQCRIERLVLKTELPIFLCYVGYKVVTALVIKHVQDFFANKPQLLLAITNTIGILVLQAKQAMLRGDWKLLGELMLVHHGLQVSMATCDAQLSKIVYQLCQCSGVYGAKISGSGLGDCVWGLGELSDNDKLLSGTLIDVEVSDEGLVFLHTKENIC